MSERIIVLREEQSVPSGTEVVRILQVEAEPTGSGTNTRNVYTVVVRDVPLE